jgi:hypothetical protein
MSLSVQPQLESALDCVAELAEMQLSLSRPSSMTVDPVHVQKMSGPAHNMALLLPSPPPLPTPVSLFPSPFLQWFLVGHTSKALARWQPALGASTSQVWGLPATAPSA